MTTKSRDAFQSYLVVGQSQEKRREKTQAIAANAGVNLEKISPDIFWLTPQKTRFNPQGSIGIDEVRTLKRHIFQKPVKLPNKIVIITDAQTLTIEAQNALLKILEEPPSSAIIILEARDKTDLLPTIVSRTTVVRTKLEKVGNYDLQALDSHDLLTTLKNLSLVDDPRTWLDEQITALYKNLKKEITNSADHKAIAESIKKYQRTKELIEANVNPKFALIDLVFSINQS